MELPPDPTEDEGAQERRLKDILATAHEYDGVCTFPKIGKRKEGNKGRFAYKRPYSSSVSSSCQDRVTKVAKVVIPSDDEEECNQQQQSPLPPPESMTPPEDEANRPPRLHRPKPPTDPRLHRQLQLPPPSPSTTEQREEAGRVMGFTSYIIENVVKRMSNEDWIEFLIRRRYGRALINELQVFLNEKYCNEEHSGRQQEYGELCNISMYPGYYPPYEHNMSAKNHHIREDGEIPMTYRRIPETFYEREFGGSVFPVYMTEEEYDYRFFTPHDWCIDDHTHPRGVYTYTQYPKYPANRMLCRRNNDGKTVERIRNMPMNHEVDEVHNEQ